MNILDPGHWTESLPTASISEILDVVNASDETAVWIGHHVTCQTLTCGGRFEIAEGTPFVPYPARAEGERRISVNCPICGLMSHASQFEIQLDVPFEVGLDNVISPVGIELSSGLFF